MGDAIEPHLRDDVGDVWVPVAHSDVDLGFGSGSTERLLQETTLLQCPFCQRWRLAPRCFAEPDLRVAMLQLGHDLRRERSPARHFAEVLRHLAKHIRRSMGEQQHRTLG